MRAAEAAAVQLRNVETLTAMYGWEESGPRVAELQTLLGVQPDGVYATVTRDAHLVALLEKALPTTGVPSPPPPPTTPPPPPTAAPVAPPANAPDGDLCTVEEIEAFVAGILGPHGIPNPEIRIDPGLSSDGSYRLGASLARFRPCPARTTVAHEIGHYVHNRASGFSTGAMTADAAAHFSGGYWLNGSEIYPGIEYAAHCIGFVLWGQGTYTRCPDEVMRGYAATVIDRA